MHRSHSRPALSTFSASPCIVCAASGVGRARQQNNPLPGTKLSMDDLRKQMFQVSAGRRLKPASWPGGARVAVALGFDVDNATATLRKGELDSEVISRGEYGAIDGLPRILRLLDKQQSPPRSSSPR